MRVSYYSYFNPLSNKHHALTNFKYLTFRQKVRAIALTILVGIPSLGIFAIPIFRLLTKSTLPTQELAKRCHRLWLKKQNLNPADFSLKKISNGNLSLVKRFLNAGGSIDKQDKEGYTLLHYAVMRDRRDLMKFLIENGASININDQRDATPLYYAVFSGLWDAAELLIENGAAINRQDKEGRSLLHYASISSFEKSKFLVDHGASIKLQDNQGKTPLHRSVLVGNLKLTKLFSQTDTVNLQDKKGNSPLHDAVRAENFEISNLLLEQGASVNQQGQEGFTPAHLAAERGHILILNLLIDKGADVDLINTNGYSVLAHAKIANHQNYKEVKRIITHQSKISKFSKRESYARHLLGHIYSLKEHSRLLPKEGSKILFLEMEGSLSGTFWKEILCDYQSLMDEYVFNNESKALLLESLKHANKKNSAEDLFKRWSEGKPIIVNTGFTGHSNTILMVKDRFFIIDRALPSGDHILTRTMPTIKESDIKTLLDLKKQDEDAHDSFMRQLIAGFEEKTEQDRQIQKNLCAEIETQLSGNCGWASRWGGTYVLFQSLGGKLSFSDVSILTMCSQTNKYLDKLNDPQNLYLPSPMLLAELTSKLRSEKSSSIVKVKADQTIKRLTQQWNDLFHYQTDDLADNVKKEWYAELEQSKILMQN